jgi:ribosomal protein L34
MDVAERPQSCYCSRFASLDREGLASIDPVSQEPPAMHYPRKVSKIKRIRKVGFRARMKTSKGRKIMNSKRRIGRRVSLR